MCETKCSICDIERKRVTIKQLTGQYRCAVASRLVTRSEWILRQIKHAESEIRMLERKASR